jgi:predicted RNase H-like HicB family nuclease
MTKTFTSAFVKEKKGYVATCLELGVVSQGKTIEDAQNNLTEAVELFLEDNDHKFPAKQYSFIGSFDVKVAA